VPTNALSGTDVALAVRLLWVTNGCADNMSGASEAPQLFCAGKQVADPLRASRKSEKVGQEETWLEVNPGGMAVLVFIHGAPRGSDALCIG
jgi:hypothetical protein